MFREFFKNTFQNLEKIKIFPNFFVFWSMAIILFCSYFFIACQTIIIDDSNANQQTSETTSSTTSEADVSHIPKPDEGSFGFVVNARDIHRSGLAPCRAEVIIGSVNSEFAFSTNLNLNTNSHMITVSIPVHALTQSEKEYLANNDVPIRINIKNESDDILGGIFEAGKRIVKKVGDEALKALKDEGKKLVEQYTGVDLDTLDILKNPNLKDILESPDFEKTIEHVLDWGGKNIGVDLPAITEALENINIPNLDPSSITNMECLLKDFDMVVQGINRNGVQFDDFELPPLGLFSNENVDQLFCFKMEDSLNQFGDKVFTYVGEFSNASANTFFAPFYSNGQVLLNKLADNRDDYLSMVENNLIPPEYCFRLETLKNGSIAMVPENDPTDNAYIEHEADAGDNIDGGLFVVKYKNPNAISASPNFRILTSAAGWEIEDLGTFFNQPVIPPAAVEIAFNVVQRNCSAGTSKFTVSDESSVTKSYTTTYSTREEISVKSEHETTSKIRAKVEFEQTWLSGSVKAEAEASHEVRNKQTQENTKSTDKGNEITFETNKTTTITQSLEVPPYSAVRGTGYWTVRENLSVPVVQKLRVTAFATVNGPNKSNPLTGTQMLSQINGLGFTGTVVEVGTNHLVVTLMGKIDVDKSIDASFASEDVGTCGR